MTLTEERQNQYFELIDKLLKCPNGEEPEILEAQPELIDAGLIQTILQVATVFAHQGNEEGAKFLIHIARELSKELGLYPEVPNKE
ncbi:hypothetical protein QUB80_31435 [Chlorogloeopsis sp. ULAP01]|uniref:hypothetical protein n=1 Tax=Chlorogloeopsis sp. ULAP01 TaxID=3056483 RepID=UPI0025AAD4B0|nr:hypothetical protein [Chlorogloeopsis sp. ULAP01]MDM9385168.1 hypothetical protein [Chlorogloeopsis sp. ULAP01]